MKEIAMSENIEDFPVNDFIYVDKTEYIFNLVKKYKRVFFSRPRRFGKSLTLNIIGTLFEQGVEPYLKGTWIEGNWSQPTYPVLRLSFLVYSVTDLNAYKRELSDDLTAMAEEFNLTKYRPDPEPHVCLKNLLHSLPGEQQIVILIDEYDCQLTANINNPELYEQFRACIRQFYAVLKGNEHIRFLAVTGVTRLRDVSIFSVGSDIIDLSYDHAFSQLIGFTREEIKKFYLDYLRLGVSYEQRKEVAEVTDQEVEELLDRMAEHYDGYCFDEFNETGVFSTYSVNTFLSAIKSNKRVLFGDYWYQAGGVPSVLANYLASHELNVEQLTSPEVVIPYNDFVNPTSLLTINENVLMCQTGYLTLRSRLVSTDDVTLGFANREVSTAMSTLLSRKVFTSREGRLTEEKRGQFERGSAGEIITLLNEALSSVVYDKYPITSESVLRALLQLYLQGGGLEVKPEIHNYKGRSDLQVNFPHRRVVLELKYAKTATSEQRLLSEAVAQLEEQGYGQEDLRGRELVRIACVFNGAKAKRQITAFQSV